MPVQVERRWSISHKHVKHLWDSSQRLLEAAKDISANFEAARNEAEQANLLLLLKGRGG